jgi:hypothetical protein
MSADLIRGCLADATTASGLGLLRDGFGRTREDDLMYALGWPRMIWLESPAGAVPRSPRTARG